MQGRLQNTINRIREWPEHHRKLLAFGVSGIVTLVIGVGWAATLPGQFAALTSPAISSTSQTAAAGLSVINPGDTQGADATQSLQGTLSQGAQLLDSVKSGWNSIFSSGTTSAENSGGQNSADQNAVPAVTITDPAQNSNPYNNLKYYVSNGVLITNPDSNTSNSAQ